MKVRVLIPFANQTGRFTEGEEVDLAPKEARQLAAADTPIVEILGAPEIETADLPAAGVEQAVVRGTGKKRAASRKKK